MSEKESEYVACQLSALIAVALSQVPEREQVTSIIMAISALGIDVKIREILLQLQTDEQGRAYQRDYTRAFQKIVNKQ